MSDHVTIIAANKHMKMETRRAFHAGYRAGYILGFREGRFLDASDPDPEVPDPEPDEAYNPEPEEADNPEPEEADDPEPEEADDPEPEEADDPEPEEADDPAVKEVEADPPVAVAAPSDPAGIPAVPVAVPAVPVAVPAVPVDGQVDPVDGQAPPLLVDLPLPERIVLEDLFDMEQNGLVSAEGRRAVYPYLDEDGTFLSAAALEGTKGDPTVFGSTKTFADFDKFFK